MSITAHEPGVTYCAGRVAVAHERTPMVDGRCSECGERDFPEPWPWWLIVSFVAVILAGWTAAVVAVVAAARVAGAVEVAG